jgi:AraC-like DNA-binding protein
MRNTSICHINAMKLQQLLFIVMLICFSMSATAADVKKQEKEIEDVYKYTFSDVNKSMSILRHLRQQKNIPAFLINQVEGDFYYNRGNYFEALKLYKRSLYDGKVEDNSIYKKKIINTILLCYDNMHNISMLSYYTKMLQRMTESDNDTAMKAVTYFNSAKLYRYSKNNTLAYLYLKKAIKTMQESSWILKFDNIYYYYVTLIEFLQEDGRNKEGLAALQKLIDVIRTEYHFSSAMKMDGIDDSYMKDIHSHYAVLLWRIGKKDEARQHYLQFINSKCEFDYDYKCIMPYLKGNGMYDDIIKLSFRRMKYLKNSGDSVGYHMQYIYRSLADAYMQKRDYAHASLYYNRLDSLTDIIKSNEEKSAISELTNNYETKDLEMAQQKQMSAMRLKAVVAIALLIIIAILGFVVRQRHFNKVVMKKNRWMAKYIDDLQKFKDEINQKTIPNDEAHADKPADDDNDEEKDPMEQMMFDKLKGRIINEQLFLDANLSRNQLLQDFHIPKNKFSSLFRKYAGTTYSKYINDLRLDYAVKLLKLHPNYTIDAIAKDCGISSVPVLYQLFSQRYGMTPAEYRSAIKNSEK